MPISILTLHLKKEEENINCSFIHSNWIQLVKVGARR